MSSTAFPTTHWHALADGRVQCDVCPRFCKLHEGQAGFCFVRAREGGEIVLRTYGRSSGFCVDPIEKKPLYHFLPGTPVLSFGTAGCNLGCKFCQNWDMTKARELEILTDQASPGRVAEAAVQLGCRSVAFTYNDPTVFLEYAADVAAACRERGIKTIAVTAGYICPAPRADLFRSIDAANVDLKSFREPFYEHVTGSHLAPVLDTLTYLKGAGVWLEITNLLIPGLNDSDAEIDDLTRWIVERLGFDVPLHFSAFHPSFRMADIPPTPKATLLHAVRIARRNGLQHVYVGNVEDAKDESTWCAGCGELLIGRKGYEITEWGLVGDGRCIDCGARCPGVFEPLPGSWGAARLPVRLGRGAVVAHEAAGR